MYIHAFYHVISNDKRYIAEMLVLHKCTVKYLFPPENALLIILVFLPIVSYCI